YRAAGRVAEVRELARATRAVRRGVVVQIGRAGRRLGDRVRLTGSHRDVGAAGAGERVAAVLAVEQHLEAVAVGGLAVRTGLRHRDLRRRLERVRERAAGGVAEVGERARATRAQGGCEVGQVGRAGRTLGDRVRNAGRDTDVGAARAVERIADVRAVALHLEAVAVVRLAARTRVASGTR